MKSFVNYIDEQSAESEGLNTHNVVYPSFLMCPPFGLSADEANNVFMKKIPPSEREVNRTKALHQFVTLYNFMAAHSMVYLLPHDYDLQDQSFVANLGKVLPHYKDGNTVVISNYKSEPRRGETEPGVKFFEMMKFDVIVAPKYFEGEADLKYLNGNNYIGAYGMRTSLNALNWFEEKFDMNIVKIENKSQDHYHLDCMVYPLYSNVVLVTTSLVPKDKLKQIEKFAEIVDVPDSVNGKGGVTNCVGLNKMVLCASELSTLKVTDEDYDYERKKVDYLSKICAQHSLEPIFFNLSEYKKNGADLSCMVMHMNYSRFAEAYTGKGMN